MKGNDIFKYLKPNANNMLSNLKGNDLIDFIILLNNYYLEYRDTLNIKDNITLGFEIECEHARTSKIIKKLDEKNVFDFEFCYDRSLTNGIEIISPIMYDNTKNWTDLKEACNIIEKYAKVGNNTASHIHIGAHILGNDINNWLNFIKIWATYENIIFRFSYGEYLNERPNIKVFAYPIADTFTYLYELLKNNSDYDDFFNNYSKLNLNKYFSVNLLNALDNYKYSNKNNNLYITNTIEFRCPNGTLEPIIWQNNANLFAKLLIYSKNNNFNHDIIDKRKTTTNINNYKIISLEQSLELADLIFNNNLDKIYFLRQYLKSYEESNKVLKKTKTFIKSIDTKV